MANIRVGKPDVKMDAPSHTKGIHQGNESGGIEHNDPAFHDAGERGAGRPSARSNARRSTGIDPESKNPIDPNSPNLSPA
jgi:hypothetical protein